MAVLIQTVRISLAVGLALLAAVPARAADASLEYAVKANYLYKFAPFVDWPAEAFSGAGAPFVICIAGADPFGAVLDQAVRGQAVQGRAVAVRRLPAAAGAGGCHVLYVGRIRGAREADVLRAVRDQPMLTVTDAEVGPARGVVHFVLRDGRVRFVIDEQAAAAARLTISSKLLALSVESGR